MEGSVEIKLWSAPSLKREYELLLNNNFIIEYCFCINDFLKNKLNSNNKKYIILNTILNENNIQIFYGDDENYFVNINNYLEK